MIVKDTDAGRAVGMWNCYDDAVLAPTVALDGEYTSVRFLGGASGHLEGTCVKFDTDIPAHAFAGFVVE